MLALSSSSNLRLSATGRSPLCDLEDYFARLAGFDRGDCGVDLMHRKAVCDDRRRIEFACAKKPRHLVPCVVHASPDNSVDREALEDNFLGKIDLDRLGRNSEHLNAAADSDRRECLMNCGGHTGHLEDDIDAEPVGGRFHDTLDLVG